MAAPDELIDAYARALFSVADAEGVLDEVEDELFRFSRALESETKLREALTDISLPGGRKRAVLEDLVKSDGSSHTLNLLTFVVEQGRARSLPAIAERLAELAAERRERAVAEVRTAVPLTRERQERLASALSRVTGKNVELRVLVDPEVVGGVLARVGDQIFDGTVRRRLEMAREHVTEA